MKSIRLLLIGSLVLLAICIGWSVQTAIRATTLGRVYQQRQEDIQELQEMQERLLKWQAMAEALESAEEMPVQDIRAMLRNAFPGLRIEVNLKQSEVAWQGWNVDTYQILIGSVPREIIGALLTLLENNRPPWRMIRIHIEALEGENDQVRLTLGIEGVRKTDL